MTDYWKFLGANGEALRGSGSWYLPHGKRPGKWMPVVKNPVLCKRGYHATTVGYLSGFVQSGVRLLGQVELRGLIVPSHDKVVAEQGRLLRVWPVEDRVLRLLACDFAEHVLPLLEARYPTDDRPRRAIEMARRYASGDATREAASASAADASAYASAASAYASAAYASAAAASASAAERLWQGQRIIEVVAGVAG